MNASLRGALRSRQRRAIADVDGWRAEPAERGGGAKYKEWMHFCVRLPSTQLGQLLVNLSIMDFSVG